MEPPAATSGNRDSFPVFVIEHVAINDLPAAWRECLSFTKKTKVRVVIEEERDNAEEVPQTASAFGMWRDRRDLDDSAAYLRKLRAPRYPGA